MVKKYVRGKALNTFYVISDIDKVKLLHLLQTATYEKTSRSTIYPIIFRDSNYLSRKSFPSRLNLTLNYAGYKPVSNREE